MDGEGHRVQIALEVEAGFLDEALVLRIVRDREERLSAVGLAHPAKVGIHKGVGARQQPRRFRRGVLAQLDGKRDCRADNHNRQRDGEGASYSHEERVRDEMIAPPSVRSVKRRVFGSPIPGHSRLRPILPL